MSNDRVRQFKQELKKLIPKKVNVTRVGSFGFCKYGRVRGDRLQSQSVMVIPINRNQNDNWKAG